MCSEPLQKNRHYGLLRSQYGTSFLRARSRLFVFFATFLIFLGVQIAVVLLIYWNSRSAITDLFETKLSSAAESAGAGVSLLAAEDAPKHVIDSMLWRVSESHRLDGALISDREGRVLGSAWGAPEGTPVSVFAASPDAVRKVFDTGEPCRESVVFLGETYSRVCYPVKRGEYVWGALCLESYDSLPEALGTIEGPLRMGLFASVAGALALGLLMLGIARLVEKTRRDVLRVEKLATAGQLAASIAHDIRNPLGIILSTSQLLTRAGTLDERDRGLLQTIQEEVHRAADHLDSFLDLTREVPLKRSRGDVREVIQNTANLFAAKSRQAGVRIDTEIPSEPLVARVDHRKIRQVLVNLMLNSIEAMAGSGGGVVRVSAGPGKDRGHIIITVQDNGPGIPSEILERVLEPFYSTKEGGTGLGLPHARQIAERHGGSMNLSSNPGRGTEITIDLPAGGEEMRDADSDS